MREREIKLLVAPDFRLPDLDGMIDDVWVARDEEIALRAVYFDTPDLRLVRSGASLRRRSGEWTLKIPETERMNGALVRTELTVPGDGELPPEKAVDLLRAWIRGAPVEVVAHVNTERHRYVLTEPGGAKLAEIDDDRVTTIARSGAREHFREIEIELAEGAPPRLARQISKRLGRVGATRQSSLPKVARALGLRPNGVEPRADHEIGGDATTAELVRLSIDDSVHRLLVHDPVIRIGEDPEGVHRARVATRRLRSDLRTFRPILDVAWSDDLREELRWFGAALGGVRDADVLSDLLRTTLAGLADADRAQAGELLDQLDAERDRERETLLRTMRSPRYVALLDRLVDAAREPRLRSDVEATRARTVTGRLARKPWKRLRRAVAALDHEPADSSLHEVRRRAKQVRYAYEAISPVESKRAPKAAARAEALQQLLGDNQDRVIARQWLADAAADHPQASFVAGELAGLLRSEQRAIRSKARGAMKKTCKKPR